MSPLVRGVGSLKGGRRQDKDEEELLFLREQQDRISDVLLVEFGFA